MGRGLPAPEPSANSGVVCRCEAQPGNSSQGSLKPPSCFFLWLSFYLFMFLILNQYRQVPGLEGCMGDGPGSSSHRVNRRAGAKGILQTESSLSAELQKAGGPRVCFMG